MPSKPRQDIVNPHEIGVYHCWNSCVQQLYLFGRDKLTGQDNSQRREWILAFEQLLASLFTIEICFYANMENHLHLVLRNRPDVAKALSDEEAVTRWLTITRMRRNGSVERMEPCPKKVAAKLSNPEEVLECRERLADISWFMGMLCETISRKINKENGRRGRLWQDRFGCHNLEDEVSILVCGMYVDLNEIRAGMASTPEESVHSSVYQRIQALRETTANAEAAEPSGSFQQNHSPGSTEPPIERMAESATSGDMLASTHAACCPRRSDDWLCELTLDETRSVHASGNVRSATGRRASDKGLLRTTLEKYLQLLDWTGRQVRSDKRGSIPTSLKPIFERLGMKSEAILMAVECPPYRCP